MHNILIGFKYVFYVFSKLSGFNKCGENVVPWSKPLKLSTPLSWLICLALWREKVASLSNIQSNEHQKTGLKISQCHWRHQCWCQAVVKLCKWANQSVLHLCCWNWHDPLESILHRWHAFYTRGNIAVWFCFGLLCKTNMFARLHFSVNLKLW